MKSVRKRRKQTRDTSWISLVSWVPVCFQSSRYGFFLLVPNLVHRLLLAPALVQPVRAVEDDALDRTDVLVGVDHARRDDQAERGRVTDDLDLFPPVGRRFRPGVPEVNLEVRRADEAEVIGLVDVFVRPAGDAGLGHRHVGHDRVELGRQFVVPE